MIIPGSVCIYIYKIMRFFASQRLEINECNYLLVILLFFYCLHLLFLFANVIFFFAFCICIFLVFFWY